MHGNPGKHLGEGKSAVTASAHLVQGGRGGALYGGYDALDFRLILVHGDAGKLGKYPIHSKLPDKFIRFLYEFHDFRFQRLHLPPLLDDRSAINVHSNLSPPQVFNISCVTMLF